MVFKSMKFIAFNILVLAIPLILVATTHSIAQAAEAGAAAAAIAAAQE
jgi:hypothetical protein